MNQNMAPRQPAAPAPAPAQTIACASCGAQVPASAKFCTECGKNPQPDVYKRQEDSRAFFTPWDILNSTTTPAGAGGTTTAG